ncbi:MAG: carboxypeptidase regulatory-like domain-containing protein, partial [Opitutaceae bacterium]|nr:carboxypeptidase regulatory-like domain-containing protein [Opitutaceae bacterium]
MTCRLRSHLRRLPGLLILLSLFAGVASAADSSAGPAAGNASSRSSTGTGSVEGRVKNAATGAYLNNARVAVAGTTLLAFTDESGTFRLSGVPVGARALEVFYTGLDVRQVTVAVTAGQAVTVDVSLTSAARYGATDVV